MGEKTYIAHISEDKTREQSVKEHAENVAKLAGEFAGVFGYEEWGVCAGLLHDIGKYSEAFQKRIHGDPKRVDHATAGAQLCWERGGLYGGLGYCIAGHHAGLPDSGEKGDASDSGTMMGRRKKKIEDYRAYQAELTVPPLTKLPFLAAEKEKQTFVLGFFLRMIYSCLVDADYLDTEDFMKDGQVERDAGESMEILCDRLNVHISDWLKNRDMETVNGRRTQILKNCLEKGREKKGFFRLTVPTGGGKTVASLAFALEHARVHGMNRVIYVIPYTSIIEQNAQVFRDILGDKNVLESHCNVDYESNEELKPMQLATENWDKPVIVTTNVQFFESLFSNKSSKCRKLHNIANSVIIFDEAQMLPNDYLKPCIEAMEELVRYYNSTVVLCTATQPALEPFFGKDVVWQELCPDREEQFRFFRRVTMENLGQISECALQERLSGENQALCILNTKKLAQRMYRSLPGEKNVFHLSTSMYPRHRKRVLEQIRSHLDNKERCIVIATSLVEAGVDLDFETVYRQLAGIDSMIQAAGRCNRNGDRLMEESCTYLFQLEESESIPGQEQQIAVARQVMQDQEDLTSQEAIREYFELLYHYRGDSLDKKEILGQFHGTRFPFATVGKEFKLIEQNTKTIFITLEERAKEIEKELRQKGHTKALMREAAQYCVNVYENDFQKLYQGGMLRVVSEDMKEDFFVLRDLEQYTEETGLLLDAETGKALMF